MRQNIQHPNSNIQIRPKSRIPTFGICKLVIVICLGFGCLMFGFPAQAGVAGQFYPADKAKLSKDIDSYLKGYKVIGGEGELIAIIVPHAGYEYSGRIAGYAYKQLTNKSFDTVIVMGPSHYVQFDGVSIMPKGEYGTPLGKIRIDEEMSAKIMSYNPKIKYVKEAWEKEHSVDVQVPFLQKTMRNFKIVPMVFGYQSMENCYMLANAIKKSIGNKKVLLVASSDMSHYHTAEVASTMDASAIDAISKGDVNLLAERLSTGECEMCGYGPVITAMIVAENLGANSYEILKYGDTGDVTGDKTAVVGYMSAAIYKRPLVLDESERTTLLGIARKTLDAYIKEGRKPDVLVYEKNLQQKSGVFVTLKKGDELKGCIGYIQPVKPLYVAVQDMTIAASTQDPRFPAVTSEEVNDINIEISVMSQLRRIQSTQEVVVGEHGLYIDNGMNSGILLPQVATENKWDRSQFLENVCLKAGLPASALNDPSTQLYVFTADVFHEEEK